MQLLFAIFCFLCTLFAGCSTPSLKKEYRIGVDASWFPLSLSGRENNVTGFSTDLLFEIGKIEKISFTKITVNWDELVEGLHKHKYDAILSSIPPYVFNQTLYDFSELYLPTGPVLVVPKDSKIDTLKMLKGKQIAVLPDTKGAIILEKYPSIILRNYDFISKALDDTINGTVDGAIIDVLSAVSFCQDLYQGKLKIATDPLNNEGLRMIALHEKTGDLLLYFNRGLEKLKSSGVYQKLLAKWNLKEKCSD